MHFKGPFPWQLVSKYPINSHLKCSLKLVSIGLFETRFKEREESKQKEKLEPICLGLSHMKSTATHSGLYNCKLQENLGHYHCTFTWLMIHNILIFNTL